MKHIVIGSRGSELALWQANFVKNSLQDLGCAVKIKIITTKGDAIQDIGFDKMEGKGFFTKEIENALLDKSIDLAVHSHKDLETSPPQGLIVAAVSERADPSDVLLISRSAVDRNAKWSLKAGALVGTSSARRKVQLRHYFPDIRVADLRGNVPTRVNKLREGQFDAIVLAKAGLDRLELDLKDFEVIVLDPTEFVPAPAQGVLAIQIRENDNELAEILERINVRDVQQRIGLERRILNLLEGGCQLPLGAYCNEDGHLFISYAPNAETSNTYLNLQVSDWDGMGEKVADQLKSLHRVS